MSTRDADVDAVAWPVVNEELELTKARLATVGGQTVRRLLPLRLRRSVGAWCFVDHYGPTSVDGVGIGVPPHPHIGIQTVTWLLAGDVLHTDSIGSEQLIRPGQLNLMTAGRGIAHAEVSPAEHDPELHGVQLWVALPDAARATAPAFEHHGELPFTRSDGFDVTVFMGSFGGLRSPATTFSDLVGAQLTALWNVRTPVALEPSFEHVIFAVRGSARVACTGREPGTGRQPGAAREPAEVALEPGSLLYLPPGREDVSVAAAGETTLILLGGVPLGEPLLMWWNFVARTPDEIAAAAAQWREGGFGAVGGYSGEPLAAPPLDQARLIRRR
jgi:redox-sensitive bicupin YhaK (pirin superfamily)